MLRTALKLLCVVSCLVIGLSVILPYFSVSGLGVTVSKKLTDDKYWIFVVVAASLALVFTLFSKYLLVVLMGFVSLGLFFLENNSITINLGKEIDALEKYFVNGGHLNYYGSGVNVQSFVNDLNPQNIYVGDAPDFYIREKDSIILFECKGIKINGSIRDKADMDEFINVLKTKLLLSAQNIDPTRKTKSKTELVGISQLVNSIEAIEDYEFEEDDKIPSDVSYYPVIVFEDSKLAQIGMMGLLNKWYRQYLLERGLTEQVCNPVIAMSVSTLYLFSDKFRIFGFQKIFDEFISTNTIDSKTDQISPFADFDWYMRKRYKIAKHIQHEFVNQVKKCISKNDVIMQRKFNLWNQ